MNDVLSKLGPYASKLKIQGKWTITETNYGYTFEREKEDEEYK